jgi:hypothetical protein
MKIMIDDPNTEVELVKKLHRLVKELDQLKEIELLETYEPSKKEISKYIEQTAKDIEQTTKDIRERILERESLRLRNEKAPRRLWVFRTYKKHVYKGDPSTICQDRINMERVRATVEEIGPISIDYTGAPDWINEELNQGRLRQGWGNIGLDLRLPTQEWVENFLIDCCIFWGEKLGDSNCEDAIGRTRILGDMLNMNIGDIVFVPRTPTDDYFTVGTVSKPYQFDNTQRYANDFRGDFRHVIELDNLGKSPNSVFPVKGIFGAPFMHAIEWIDPNYQTYRFFEYYANVIYAFYVHNK